jgi:predicted ArsR family transcriptional regulator
MAKRTSYEIERRVLHVLREGPESLAKLERKVNTGYRTVKAICQKLETYGAVEIAQIQRHPQNGRPAYTVKLTSHGRTTLNKMNEKR